MALISNLPRLLVNTVNQAGIFLSHPTKKATGLETSSKRLLFQWLFITEFYKGLCFSSFVGVTANGCVRQHELEAVQLVYLAGTWVKVNGGDI